MIETRNNGTEFIDRITAPTFEIGIIGKFSRKNVTVSDNKAGFVLPPDVQNRVNEIWDARPADIPLEDRQNLILIGKNQQGDRLHLQVGRGLYRTHYAFRSDSRLADQYPELIPQLFTVAAILKTSDDYLVLNHRSGQVFRFPKWIGALGGSVEMDDTDKTGKIDPFISAAREISEEVGIERNDIKKIRCLGFMRDRLTNIEVMLFTADTQLTKGQIEKKQSAKPSREGENIFLPVDPKKVAEQLARFSLATVTDASALLTIFGQERFGQEWLNNAIARINLRADIYTAFPADVQNRLRQVAVNRTQKTKSEAVESYPPSLYNPNMDKLIEAQKIPGDRVQLTQITSADLELLREWRNENRSYFFDSSIISKEQQEKWFNDIYSKKQDDVIFAIKTLEGTTVGFVSLYHIDPVKKEAEYGRVVIADQYKRKGYGQDATRALADYAFSDMKLGKIRLEVIDSNERAIGLYKKIGFKTVKNSPDSPPETITMVLNAASYIK